MKFGKTLDRCRLPEWSNHYLAYTEGKKLLKVWAVQYEETKNHNGDQNKLASNTQSDSTSQSDLDVVLDQGQPQQATNHHDSTINDISIPFRQFLRVELRKIEKHYKMLCDLISYRLGQLERDFARDQETESALVVEGQQTQPIRSIRNDVDNLNENSVVNLDILTDAAHSSTKTVQQPPSPISSPNSNLDKRSLSRQDKSKSKQQQVKIVPQTSIVQNVESDLAFYQYQNDHTASESQSQTATAISSNTVTPSTDQSTTSGESVVSSSNTETAAMAFMSNSLTSSLISSPATPSGTFTNQNFDLLSKQSDQNQNLTLSHSQSELALKVESKSAYTQSSRASSDSKFKSMFFSPKNESPNPSTKKTPETRKSLDRKFADKLLLSV